MSYNLLDVFYRKNFGWKIQKDSTFSHVLFESEMLAQPFSIYVAAFTGVRIIYVNHDSRGCSG